MRAIEVPTHQREGIDLTALEQTIKKHNPKACWIMTTFQNPMGSGTTRPLPAKAFDEAGLVLHCSSFSKCLAPGYRIGWVAPAAMPVQWLCRSCRQR